MMLPLNLHLMFVTPADAVRPVKILADFRLLVSEGRRSIQLSYSRTTNREIPACAPLLKWNLRAVSSPGAS